MIFDETVGGELLAELVHDDDTLEQPLLLLVLQPHEQNNTGVYNVLYNLFHPHFFKMMRCPLPLFPY